MITRIELVNYMSHRHTVLEPAEGLTVLTGPNNCGKSAVADALRTVCGLNRGDYMVRHGEKAASVTVATGEGEAVTWTRNRDTVSWTLSGRDVHRDTPEDLQDKLRLPLVKAEGAGAEFSVHLADQKQPLFLLGMPPSAPAVFFSAASDARHFITMRQAHKQRTQALKDAAKRLRGELEAVDRLLGILEPVPAMTGQVEDLEARFEQLRGALEQDRRLAGLCAALAQGQAQAARLGRERDLLGHLPAPLALADGRPLERLLASLQACRADLECQQGRHAALARLQPPPALADAGALERLWRRLAAQALEAGRLAQEAQCLRSLPVPPTPKDPLPLQALTARLHKARAEAQAAQAGLGGLGPLREPPALQDPAPLARCIDQLVGAGRRVQELRGEAASLDEELAGFLGEARAWLAGHGTCPTCGQALDEAALLGGGVHGH